MTAAREALTLPAMFLTVALLGGLRIDERVALVPPSLWALVLALLLLGLLVRCGAFAPDRLIHGGRTALANLNGLIVTLALFLATTQAVGLVTPESGLPRVLANLFFLVLLANTLAASAGRIRVLRSMFVILGSAFVLKFIILAALSSPADSLFARALRVVFEGVTLGAITQEVIHPAAGYLAFVTVLLYLFGLVLLPARDQIDSGGHHGHQTYAQPRTLGARDLVDP